MSSRNRMLLVATVALCALACEEDTSSNTVNFSVGDESYDWSSDDGGCQLRNQSSSMYCFVDVGAQPDEEDLSFSVAVAFSGVIEEETYVDTQETEFPNVDVSLWSDGCRFEAPTSGDDQTLTIYRLRDASVQGTLEGTVECADTGASVPLTGKGAKN